MKPEEVIYINGNKDALEYDLNIKTDSRSIDSKSAFICLNGEKYRGSQFIREALDQGAKIVITENDKSDDLDLSSLCLDYPESCFIFVENANKYFQTLAYLWAKQWKEKDSRRFLIGVTGSNGKTTTKEMLTSILERIFPNQILSTYGNLNNLFGVPMTLLRLTDQHQVGVIELGANRPGEIDCLSRIVNPEAGIITSIGAAHLELLGDLEGVFKEKRSLYDHFSTNPRKKVFVVNSDDPFLERLTSNGDVSGVKKKEDINNSQYPFCYSLRDGDILLRLNEQTLKITNSSILGKHNIINLINTVSLVGLLFPDIISKIEEAASQIRDQNSNRGNWVDRGNLAIYLDAYNANPDSMKASFDTFLSACSHEFSMGRKLRVYFILGDMNELGVESDRYHEEIGLYVKSQLKAINFEREVLFVGTKSKGYKKGFGDKCRVFDKKEDLKKYLEGLVFSSKEKSFLFLKASRSLQLESLVDIFDSR